MCTNDIDRRRRRKPGDLGSLRRSLWASIVTMETHIANEDPQIAIRAAHALATLSGTYLKAIDAGDIAARLDRVEAALGTGNIREFRRPA